MPFMPNFLRKDLAMWLISLNILALLASVFPWSLGKPIRPAGARAPLGIHPEWYFMSPFEMLKLLGMMKWLQRICRDWRDCGHSALHARHRALGSDSLLRQEQGIRTARPRRALLWPAGGLRAAGHHRHRLLDDSVMG
jgi:hypothetical protein